jgi:hypothetical protein
MILPTEIRVGDFVCIVDIRPGSSYAPSNVPTFDGVPFEVTAVDLPFVLLADGARRFAVDVRGFELKLATSQYVRAYRHPGYDQSRSRFAPYSLAVRG